MLKITFYEFKQLAERRKNAISDAKMNCEALRTLVFYGVPNFIDRVPSCTSSILIMPTGSSTTTDSKYNTILTQEQDDQIFIRKMINLINSLSDTYKEIFVDVFINCSKKSSYYNNEGKEYLNRKDIYKILERGYLKLALVDYEINYSIFEECKYNNFLTSQKEKQKRMVAIMKLRLKELQTFLILENIKLIDTNTGAAFSIEEKIFFEENRTFSLVNINLLKKDFDRLNIFIKWLNELFWGDQKAALLKFLLTKDWKYLDTTDRSNLTKGLLALALLDPETDYTYLEFNNDLNRLGNSRRFIELFKNYQFGLSI